MLDIYTDTKILNKNECEVEKHWSCLQNELLTLVQERIDSSTQRWYQEDYMYQVFDIDSFNPKTPCEVNRLPKGIVAEVFFLAACKNLGIDCNPCSGTEDVLGADFSITHEDETRFFDVSINTTELSFNYKVREGRFPTLFIPWKESEQFHVNGYIRSYAERYLRDGTFNSEMYLGNMISSNYVILDCLKRKYWRDEKAKKEISKNEKYNYDYSRAGIQYIKGLEATLLLVRKSMGS